MFRQNSLFIIILIILFVATRSSAQTETNLLVNEPVDISPDFRNFTNTYYLADSLVSFDLATASGTIQWQQCRYIRRYAFDNDMAALQPYPGNVFPQSEYSINPVLSFSIQFISSRSFRISTKTGVTTHEEKDSLMLVKEPITDNSWTPSKTKDGFLYKSNYGTVLIKTYPFHIEVRDANGKLLTSTYHSRDNANDFTPVLPFSFVRRAADMSRSIAASFMLSPGEKIF